MFLIRGLYDLFSNTQDDRAKNLEALKIKLDETIQNDENNLNGIFYNNIVKDKKKKIENSELKNEFGDCFKKIGTITEVKSSHGIIDDIHMFNIQKVGGEEFDLRIGYKVEYLAYKPHADADIRICKILGIVDYSWDNTETGNENPVVADLRESFPERFNKHHRNFMGTIKARKNNILYADTDEQSLEIDMEKSQINYVPYDGDRVSLTCLVQTDNTMLNKSGIILDCTSVTYARLRKHQGKIKCIEREWGVIGDDTYFYFDALDMGYRPSVGDLVNTDSVENDSNISYQFRSIKISLLEKAPKDYEIIENKNIENDLTKNKNGIVVTNNIHFKFEKLDQISTKNLQVSNTSDYTQEITHYVFKTGIFNSQLRLRNANEVKANLKLEPGGSLIFKMNAKSKKFGLSTEVFEIHFKDFMIVRNIDIEVGDIKRDPNSNQVNDNKRVGGNSSRNRYQNAKLKWDNTQKRNLVPGVNVTVRPRFIKQQIQLHEVPDRMKGILLSAENRETAQKNIETAYPSLNEELKPENYSQKLSILLHLEEIERFIQMRQYDRERAHFEKEGEYLSLIIENLAEKRPSLILGDTIHASTPWVTDENKQIYQGFIHKVLNNKVLIKFNDAFHAKYNGEDYRLEFYFSRSSFRKMHHSVHNVQSRLSNDVLFPNKLITRKIAQLDVELIENENLQNRITKQITPWFNQNLNHYQKVAIKNILRGEVRPMPYVIFGPPGTGKTLTVIETILQLFKNCTDSRILIGTPTNSAADLIATRLIESAEVIPGDFVRLVGQTLLERDLLPDYLKPYCATVDIAIDGTAKDEMITTDSGLKLKCRSKYLGSHRIIIGTCITLGTLLYLGFPKNQFTHVIIDEAGQCIEPEMMTVIKQIEGTGGQIILAGDPLQLGPVVINKYAADKGLETSFLVRVLATYPYSKDKVRFSHTGYNPILVTKLINSYRSIPSILNGYNDLFYDSELVPMITDDNCKEFKLLKSIEGVLNEYFSRTATPKGLRFWGIRGQNRQDTDSPSWYNAEEASQLYLFTLKLLKAKIQPSQIGIITPYQKQVKKIRQLFEAVDMVDFPKIGTVEEFQGQERDIILISTVRSSKSLIQTDLKYTLGFLQSPKRMNVSISRARALLIIFGNPHLLALDENWKKLILYCIAEKTTTGCDLPQNLKNPNDDDDEDNSDCMSDISF